MEIRASYLIVGAVVLALLAGLAAFSMWLVRADVDRDVARYEIAFSGSVSGLQEGGQVLYRGIPVGRVAEIRIDPDNVENVLVAVDIERDTPIKADTVATLEFQGLTGIAYVQLRGGTQASARLDPDAEPVPRIPSRPSAVERLFESTPELLARAVALTDRLGLLLDRREPGCRGRHLAQRRDGDRHARRPLRQHRSRARGSGRDDRDDAGDLAGGQESGERSQAADRPGRSTGRGGGRRSGHDARGAAGRRGLADRRGRPARADPRSARGAGRRLRRHGAVRVHAADRGDAPAGRGAQPDHQGVRARPRRIPDRPQQSGGTSPNDAARLACAAWRSSPDASRSARAPPPCSSPRRSRPGCTS